MRTRRRATSWVIFIVILIAALLVLLDPPLRALFLHMFSLKTINDLRAYVRSLGPWGPIALIALMVLHSVTFVPAEVISISDVVIFGPVLGLVYAWIGAMLGAYLSYFLARWFGRPIVNRFVPKRLLERFDTFFESEGLKGVLILRLIPLVSFNALNYASGLTKMTFWDFTWTTGLGILPMEILISVLYQSAVGEKYAVVGLTIVGIALLVGLVIRLKLRKKYKGFGKE
ncbi:TVP38/TMEM64 family protein [Alicyclobacillus ferrooxydans]|uniref:TVP38/TMEM64 family protein n=1 Tax=Alicyclobacillus ferrooxydans TaxID=471514 RepID=UPI0009F83A84|nr:TVP38/TMEM64 family protein [Alicyclobacillus ferrooxydans]